jgi:DNA processing protein
MSYEPDPRRLAAWRALPGNRCIALRDDDYPPLLARIANPPPLLYVHGDPAVLWRAQVAVVGSRRASPGGLANAREFCLGLAGAGLAITSGLARGIDAAAHAAALEAGAPTVAVCATGLDEVYPPRHRALAARIGLDGALVSEFPPGTPARAPHFPQRNRIIAGLALGILVVEAGLRSGSLITARLAGDYGREVHAIPGSIHHPLARGCHRLIRDGARLVEGVDEVLEGLGPLARSLGADIAARLVRATAACAPRWATTRCRSMPWSCVPG